MSLSDSDVVIFFPPILNEYKDKDVGQPIGWEVERKARGKEANIVTNTKIKYRDGKKYLHNWFETTRLDGSILST